MLVYCSDSTGRRNGVLRGTYRSFADGSAAALRGFFGRG
jgi:hypothetical protein